MASNGKPQVLFVYYTYTRQTLTVMETMAEVLRSRGCDVALAAIEFDDPRYADRFKTFPMPHPFREVLGMIPADTVLAGRSFAVAAACRRHGKHNSKTERRLGAKRGGTYVDGIHFRYQGGQVRSLLSRIGYLGSGAYRERYLGVKIPPTNLQGCHFGEARAFSGELADRLTARSSPAQST